MPKHGWLYLMTNKYHTVIYTGVTNDLIKRGWKHKNGFYPNSFTKRYNVNKLVYNEKYLSIADAIVREKQIKAGSRKKKIALIKSMNPEWKDMWEEIL